MEDKEMKDIKSRIKEVGEKLKQYCFTQILFGNGANESIFTLDYRIVGNLEKAGIVPIFHYPGITSGWEYAIELPFYLWYFCNIPSIVISPPGESNSSPAPRWFYATKDFKNEARLALMFLKKIGVKKVILSGHSNGAVVVSEMARMSQSLGVEVEALILLNPADLKKIYNYPWIIARFAISGIMLRRKFGKDFSVINELEKYFPPFNGPFKLNHLMKMYYEFRKSSQGKLPEILKEVKCPVISIFSDKDFVFPQKPIFALKSRADIIRGSVLRDKYYVTIIEGLHNITLYKYAEITAKRIGEMLVRI